MINEKRFWYFYSAFLICSSIFISQRMQSRYCSRCHVLSYVLTYFKNHCSGRCDIPQCTPIHHHHLCSDFFNVSEFSMLLFSQCELFRSIKVLYVSRPPMGLLDAPRSWSGRVDSIFFIFKVFDLFNFFLWIHLIARILSHKKEH